MTTHLSMVAEAFGELARLVNLNGRRLDRAYRAYQSRLYIPEEGNSARTAPMERRAIRRDRVREIRKQMKRLHPRLNRHNLRDRMPFRPVYGHGIPASDHKLIIAALITKKKCTT